MLDLEAPSKLIATKQSCGAKQSKSTFSRNSKLRQSRLTDDNEDHGNELHTSQSITTARQPTAPSPASTEPYEKSSTEDGSAHSQIISVSRETFQAKPNNKQPQQHHYGSSDISQRTTHFVRL